MLAEERLLLATDASPQVHRSPRRLLIGALPFIVYAGLAVFAYHETSFFSSARLPQDAVGDQVQEVWFLAWPPYALLHGLNPFFTTWLNHPPGVNLTINTSMPLLGLLGAPLTLSVGPVASYNCLLAASFAISALAMYWVLRRFSVSPGAAFFGGLLYGFSPYMIGQGNGHLFLTFVPLPPLVFYALHQLVIEQRGSPRRWGVFLGVLFIGQYYISPEVLAMTIIVSAVGIIVLAALHPRSVRPRVRRVAVGLGVGACIGALGIAYPVWFSLFGPQHITGPPHPLAALAPYTGDLLGGILPTVSQHFAPAHLQQIGTSLSAGDVTENGLYLGLPLLCVLAVFTALYRRAGIVAFAAIMLVLSYVLALGPRLVIDGTTTGIRLPFTILRHVPFIQDIEAARFSLFVQLFAAVLLAVGLDATWKRVTERQERTHARGDHRVWLPLTTTAVVVVVALVPLVPQLPYSGAATQIAPVTVGTGRDQIPPGSVSLTYPYPRNPELQGMLLQAVNGLGYKMVGGYAFVPLPDGSSSTDPTVLAPSQVQAIFYTAYAGPAPGQSYPTLDAPEIRTLRAFLSRYRIRSMIFYPNGENPALALKYMEKAVGPPQVHSHEFTAWFDVVTRLRGAGAR